MIKHLAVSRTTSSCSLIALVGFALALSGEFARVIAADPPATDKSGGMRVLPTDDNYQIYITYFPAPGDREAITKEAPVVVLLHGDKQNRLVYEGKGGLAARLQGLGFAVITVDLRKHGQSTNVAQVGGGSPASGRSEATVTAADYRAMVDSDLEAVKHYIHQRHQEKKLNMRKMGIVGAGSMVGVAAEFARADWNKEPYDDAPSEEMKTPRGQDVRAVVFLSPPARVRGLNLNEAITELRNPDWNIAFLTLYGKANRSDTKDAVALDKRLTGTSKASKDRVYLVPVNVPSRGTDLLGIRDIDTESAIIKFFERHLLKLRDSEWRDRQSRLNRK
jgi:pimeloyl-ACP methyl ester carboxylesterase